MAEEQQLAHDLYLGFAHKYGASVFGCMSSDETSQLTDTRKLLKLYAVDDPTAGLPVGTFANAATKLLYDQLVTQGATSVDTANAAAQTVESGRITDLKAAAADPTAPAVLQLYTNLLDTSQRHLRAVGG